MARYYIDCRDYPSDKNCSVALSADMLEAAIQHGTRLHGYTATRTPRISGSK
jgi:hypothetical protein